MGSRVIRQEVAVGREVKMRGGRLEDLDSLMAVCRQSFPDHYRWQSLYPIGRKWWRTVLQSESCHVLVLEDSIGIFALNVLVLDVVLWGKERKKRNGSIPQRVISVLCCPFPAVWKRLCIVGMVLVTNRKSIGRRVGKHEQKRTVWSEITAVAPRMRRKGFGMLLNKARSQIALDAGANVIQTHIESWNLGSRRMNEKMGYVLVYEDTRGCLYEKSLVEEEGSLEQRG